LCDGFFSARAESFFCGNNPVEKNLLENYLLYRNEIFTHDGILPMCYPSVPIDKDDFIPNWVLWYVLELEDYVARTGDSAFVAEHAWRIRLVLDYFQGKENEFGLLENLEGWVFVEWSRANDFVDGVNFPSNMCYYGALRAAAKLLSDKALAEKAERLKQTIIEKSYNGTFFVDNALRENGILKSTENISETCQNYAAFFEIFTKQENPEFYQRLIKELGCFHREDYHPNVHVSNMFIGYILRLSILLREGERAAVLAECKNRFGSMAAETGTIWELFQTNASCNHGFGAVVGQMIVCAVTGLVRVDETQKKVYFSPDFEKVNGRAECPLQNGKVIIVLDDGARSVEVSGGYHVEVL
jgi:alpha-L-rhamnosidase